MDIFTLPFSDAIRDSENILIAGAGGGFDVFCGLPLYFGLKNAGKQVYLANLSFSTLYASTGRRMGTALVRVDADTEGTDHYFPELFLSQWFRTQREEVPIYCIDRTGAKPVAAAYQTLAKHLEIDTVILIDGGTDSLMRGDEAGLGTPQEDIASIAAVHQLDVAKKLLVCIGFGVDTYHGVCHAQFLEAVAAITRSGGFLGAWTVMPEMPEAMRYQEATDAVFRVMRSHQSIVSSSILSAIEGQFGNYHSIVRTEGSTLFINPLMTLYWGFQLDAVAERNLYLTEIQETETYTDLTLEIEKFRATGPPSKPWVDLPM